MYFQITRGSKTGAELFDSKPIILLVLIQSMSGGIYNLNLAKNDRFLKNFAMLSFCQKSAESKSPWKYFHVSTIFRFVGQCLTCGSNRDFTSNMPALHTLHLESIKYVAFHHSLYLFVELKFNLKT